MLRGRIVLSLILWATPCYGRHSPDTVTSFSLGFVPGQVAPSFAPRFHGLASRATNQFSVCRYPQLRNSRKGDFGIASTRCQIKFADAVAELLKRRFNEDKVGRVIDSWYKMDEDYIHRERIEEFDTIQEANSYISGLEVKAFHDPYQFGWARSLRDKASIIQDEFRRVAVLGAEELEAKGNNVWATAANATSASSYGPDWKTLALMDRCVWDDINTNLFPETTRLLRELEVAPPSPLPFSRSHLRRDRAAPGFSRMRRTKMVATRRPPSPSRRPRAHG
jgi:hypothetical protein